LGIIFSKLINILKCDSCKDVLCATDIKCVINSLITLKNKGDNGELIYSSNDIINIYFQTGNALKIFIYTNKALKLKIQSDVLANFLFNSNVFQKLKTHKSKVRNPSTTLNNIHNINILKF